MSALAQESRLEVAAFRKAFATLSADHKTALFLTAVEGLPYEEVARIMGVEVGTIKSRVNRARGALKRMLLDEPSVEPDKARFECLRAWALRAVEEAAANAAKSVEAQRYALPASAPRLRF